MSSQVLGIIEPKMTRAVEVLERDLQGIRTGRASTALVERIHVEYYGTSTPLNQLAGISVPEPHQIVIQPWDRSVLGAIADLPGARAEARTPAARAALQRLGRALGSVIYLGDELEPVFGGHGTGRRMVLWRN